MIFSLAIYSAPYSSQANDTAFRFAQAALASGHSLYRIFFYGDGVHNGSSLITPPQDDVNIASRWKKLAEDHQIDLVVCIAAALKRGILNAHEAARYEKPTANLAPHFELSGLGQLVDAAVASDRLITFGS